MKEQKKGIVFVADHWGEYHGGIDVFNQKLCEAMSYVVDQEKVKVICLVMGTVADALKEKARARNIIVLDYTKEDSEQEDVICERAVKLVRKNVPNIDLIWIGHDVITGNRACKMSEINLNDKVGIIFHTDYYGVSENEGNNDWGEQEDKTNDKIENQIKLAKYADWVFGVGPMVSSNLSKQCNRDIEMIIPGLEEKIKSDGSFGNILVAGRFDEKTKGQKNWERVCEAIGYMLNEVERPANITITFLGFNPNLESTKLKELQSNLQSKIKEKTSNSPRVKVSIFDVKRVDYLKKLARSAVFVMASQKESFGLVAWEALSLEIPIVISTYSGLHEYLKNQLGYLLRGLCGEFDGYSDDANKQMGKSIAEIFKNNENINNATKLLREKMDGHKWETTAIQVANKIGIKGVMSAAIFDNQDYAEFTYAKRELFLEELKRRIQNKKIERRAIFFGGISREILEYDENFLMALPKLLCSEGKESVEIYFCYESVEAMKQRMQELDEERGADRKILYSKAEKASVIKDTLKKLYCEKNISEETDKSFEEIENRIHVIPLEKCPSVYINILDDDWYFTLKYENRSSENVTAKLSKEGAGIEQRKRLVDHMKFILKNTKDQRLYRDAIEEIEKCVEVLNGTY